MVSFRVLDDEEAIDWHVLNHPGCKCRYCGDVREHVSLMTDGEPCHFEGNTMNLVMDGVCIECALATISQWLDGEAI